MGFSFIPEVRRRSQRRVVIAVAVLSLTCACRSTPTLAKLERGGRGPATMVLLHGYGSSAEEWLPFVSTIRLPEGGRFVFPQAPETTTPPDGPSTGRAWWRLDLGSHPSSSPGGGPDLSATRPPGLKVAAAMVEELVKNVERAGGKPILLGGFSQGAMVAAEVALQSDGHVDALVLLSGTLVDEASWQQRFATLRNVPVFMSHGTADPVLPFAVADRFRTGLQAAGVKVTWVPFDGGHEMPMVVIDELNQFIARLGPRQ
jgi:phospholipase/carboxylesterase